MGADMGDGGLWHLVTPNGSERPSLLNESANRNAATETSLPTDPSRPRVLKSN